MSDIALIDDAFATRCHTCFMLPRRRFTLRRGVLWLLRDIAARVVFIRRAPRICCSADARRFICLAPISSRACHDIIRKMSYDGASRAARRHHITTRYM